MKLYLDGTVIASSPATYYGNRHPYWDTTGYISKSSYVYLSVFLWGAYNRDHIYFGNFNIGAV
jgi:hypothetical protein